MTHDEFSALAMLHRNGIDRDKEMPNQHVLRGTIGLRCLGAIDYLVNHEGYRTRDER